MRDMVSWGVAALCVLALAHLNGTIWLGAHPFWSVQVAYIGLGVGAVVLMLMRWLGMPKRFGILGFGGGLMVAAAVTVYGKHGFTASYGEDRFAGHLWYYGWIAICTMLFCVLATALSRATD